MALVDLGEEGHPGSIQAGLRIRSGLPLHVSKYQAVWAEGAFEGGVWYGTAFETGRNPLKNFLYMFHSIDFWEVEEL